jgi:hypothetical protein
MPAVSFSVFRDKIESGAKRQTIRKIRKNPVKQGDNLFLYWKQQAGAPHCAKLGEAVCQSITPVFISVDGVNIDNDKFLIINQNGLDKFAIADGFENWQQMIEFFDKTHGLPFTGVLIQWDEIV